jgi:hypothetical protein
MWRAVAGAARSVSTVDGRHRFGMSAVCGCIDSTMRGCVLTGGGGAPWQLRHAAAWEGGFCTMGLRLVPASFVSERGGGRLRVS